MIAWIRRLRAPQVIIDDGHVLVTTQRRINAKQRQKFIEAFNAAHEVRP